jgi:hypothetical protein
LPASSIIKPMSRCVWLTAPIYTISAVNGNWRHVILCLSCRRYFYWDFFSLSQMRASLVSLLYAVYK